MNPIRKLLSWISGKTGLSQRLIFWSIFAMIFMLLFSLLFTVPLHTRMQSLRAENANTEAHVQELVLLEMLDVKLKRVLSETYPEVEEINADAFEEENLLELPSRFEELAAASTVTLISIDSQSIEDGASIAIEATFQGRIENLYLMLRHIGRVKYVKRLEALTILALPDGEQMQLKFTVPVK